MDSYIVQLTSKGQLTLPAAIRRKLAMGKGTKLFVVLDKDEIRLKKMESGNIPVFSKNSTFLDLIGSFEGPRNLAEKHDSYLSEKP